MCHDKEQLRLIYELLYIYCLYVAVLYTVGKYIPKCSCLWIMSESAAWLSYLQKMVIMSDRLWMKTVFDSIFHMQQYHICDPWTHTQPHLSCLCLNMAVHLLYHCVAEEKQSFDQAVVIYI